MKKVLCNLLGHDVKEILLPDSVQYLGGGVWKHPAMASFCPRCGMVYKNATVSEAELQQAINFLLGGDAK